MLTSKASDCALHAESIMVDANNVVCMMCTVFSQLPAHLRPETAAELDEAISRILQKDYGPGYTLADLFYEAEDVAGDLSVYLFPPAASSSGASSGTPPF